MCGIAGYVGEKKISKLIIDKCLNSLVERGPDNQKAIQQIKDNKKILLLHSRLSIIDLNKRSNQPFSKHGLKLIFNGEIYNFISIRDDLKKKGHKFKTNSDTEVVITGFYEYGVKIFKLLKGMWSLAIWNSKSNELLLSRDRFGEKPLYYYHDKKNFYFGSQIKQIILLSNQKLKVNEKQIINYLALGYRSLEKYNMTFFKNIKKVPNASYLKFNLKKIIIKKYWMLKFKPDYNLSKKDITEKVREKVTEAVKRTTTSDVPLSITLSGGIDSNIILSIIKKIVKKEVHSFSIVDRDKRYDESLAINKTNKIINHLNTKLYLKKIKFNSFISKIEDIIEYNSMPMYTITSYVSNALHRLIKKKGFKVSISGIGADELFAGYYDHGLYFLASQKKNKEFKKHYYFWKKNIRKFIRNPYLRNVNIFLKNNYYSQHIFNGDKNILSLLNKKNYSLFVDHFFCKDILRNRMLNELFYETIPPILNEDDQNQMFSSVENRSPFLDVDLVEFANTIPSKFLINEGFGKSLLRDAFSFIVPKHIIQNKIKTGFNASIDSIFYRKSKLFNNYFLDKNLLIYNYIDYNKIQNFLKKKTLSNSESMFIFRIINCNIFLERFK
jgi:asparagine synthase (glutamine-hydrolysing)